MTVVHTARAPRDPGRPRIALAAGTRPEWLKLASTMRRRHELDPKSMVVLDIQQQPELVGSLLAEYGLQQLPRVRVASGGPGLADRFGTTTKAVARTLETLPCAALVVQGDTTSALAQLSRDSTPACRWSTSKPAFDRVISPRPFRRRGTGR